jgi:hypothetical protein
MLSGSHRIAISPQVAGFIVAREFKRLAQRQEAPHLTEFCEALEPNGARKMPATSRCAESHRLGILGK